jgi:hypothetical protein
MRQTAQRRDRARQCDTKGAGANQRPAAKISQIEEPQTCSFPQSPKERAIAIAMVTALHRRHMIPSCAVKEKRKRADPDRP